jgi:Na+/H+ antiporter NhaD/arsenite permease-like protein
MIYYAVTMFVVAYAFIISERFNKTRVALVGAGLMVCLPVIDSPDVFYSQDNGIDWDVIFLMLGMMMMALASAVLPNVVSVLLIAPVTLLVCDALEINPVQLLLAEVFASNVGGAAALVGDPPNIIIGARKALSFNAFLVNMAPI